MNNNDARPPFRFADPRQKRINDLLYRLVGAGPAAFYRDACQIMSNPDALETTAQLVAHCIREIESALQDILEPQQSKEGTKKKKARGQGRDHERKVREILERLEIPESDFVAQTWITITNKDNAMALHRRAHRRSLE